jgi:hypothetical protein
MKVIFYYNMINQTVKNAFHYNIDAVSTKRKDNDAGYTGRRYNPIANTRDC